jgi:uncharacterized membrane protein
MALAKPRYVYIDLLRGWAVLVMVETHVVNAFIAVPIRSEWWFGVVNFINGIVAPSFLFVAGYAFALVGRRKWGDYLAMNSVFRKQIMRILQIWIVGYALHIPFYSFRKLAYYATAAEWLPFWKVDVLHCIACSILFLLILVLLMRDRRMFFYATLISCLGIIYATPFLWTANVDAVFPIQVANYFNALHGSLFPLFPWMGFVFAGAVIGQLYVLKTEKSDDPVFFRNIFIAGIALIIISGIGSALPVHIVPEPEYGKTAPGFFFIRLGIVLMILSTLWYWEQVAHSGKSLASLFGSESLVAYAGHLLVIYGLFFNGHSLSYLIGKTRTIPEVLGMTILLIVFIWGIVYVWNALKKRSMLYARVLQYSILAVAVAVFVLKPF